MCHEILLGVGPLESHGSQRLLLYGEILLLRSHEIMWFWNTFIPLTRMLVWITWSRADVTEVFLHTIGVSESRDSLVVLLPAVSHDNVCDRYFRFLEFPKFKTLWVLFTNLRWRSAMVEGAGAGLMQQDVLLDAVRLIFATQPGFPTSGTIYVLKVLPRC